MNVQLVDELREVADWFRLRGLDENAALLDHAAHVVQCAANFFAWYNKYYPEPSSHPRHPWRVLGVLLTHDKNDSARAALGTMTDIIERLRIESRREPHEPKENSND